jgi:NAD(P)-dependent dehydrogenase (short-subunit alcohol dehydrogenase family)
MAETAEHATYPGLRGRVALVSGGATGIGEAIVRAFAQQHARVVFLDVAEEAAERLCQGIAADGLDAPTYIACDVTDTAALRRAVDTVVDRFGTIDILVNNAANDTRHTIEEVTSETWDTMIAVNLKHQFFLTQAVLPAMRRAQAGSIINMSSISWMIPSTGLPVYVTSKAAIVGMTRTLAHELGPDNIRVNCVLPGAILTERQQRLWMTPAYEAEVMARQALKRHIQPDEVARLVLFLASDDSSSITNGSFVIDAGWV